MKVHMVCVVTTNGRYIDSFWVEEKSAIARVSQLKRSWEMAGLHVTSSFGDGWHAFICKSAIEDASLAPKEGKS